MCDQKGDSVLSHHIRRCGNLVWEAHTFGQHQARPELATLDRNKKSDRKSDYRTLRYRIER